MSETKHTPEAEAMVAYLWRKVKAIEEGRAALLEAAEDAFFQFEHNGNEAPEDKAVLDRLTAAISAARGE